MVQGSGRGPECCFEIAIAKFSRSVAATGSSGVRGVVSSLIGSAHGIDGRWIHRSVMAEHITRRQTSVPPAAGRSPDDSLFIFEAERVETRLQGGIHIAPDGLEILTYGIPNALSGVPLCCSCLLGCTTQVEDERDTLKPRFQFLSEPSHIGGNSKFIQ